jgi:hypothetical protein
MRVREGRGPKGNRVGGGRWHFGIRSNRRAREHGQRFGCIAHHVRDGQARVDFDRHQTRMFIGRAELFVQARVELEEVERVLRTLR